MSKRSKGPRVQNKINGTPQRMNWFVSPEGHHPLFSFLYPRKLKCMPTRDLVNWGRPLTWELGRQGYCRELVGQPGCLLRQAPVPEISNELGCGLLWMEFKNRPVGPAYHYQPMNGLSI